MVSSLTIERRKRPTHLAPSSDRRDHACTRCRAYTPHRRLACPWGHCSDMYCTRCGRFSWGMGFMECPCDTGPRVSGGHGHHTRAEQPRPNAPVKGRGRR